MDEIIFYETYKPDTSTPHMTILIEPQITDFFDVVEATFLLRAPHIILFWFTQHCEVDKPDIVYRLKYVPNYLIRIPIVAGNIK